MVLRGFSFLCCLSLANTLIIYEFICSEEKKIVLSSFRVAEGFKHVFARYQCTQKRILPFKNLFSLAL